MRAKFRKAIRILGTTANMQKQTVGRSPDAEAERSVHSLVGLQMSKRPAVTVVYATETGKSLAFAQWLVRDLGRFLNPKVSFCLLTCSVPMPIRLSP